MPDCHGTTIYNERAATAAGSACITMDLTPNIHPDFLNMATPFLTVQHQPATYVTATSAAAGDAATIPQSLKATYHSSWSKLLCFVPITVKFHTMNQSPGSSQSLELRLPKAYYGDLILKSVGDSEHHLARASQEGRHGYSISLRGNAVVQDLRVTGTRRQCWWFALPAGAHGQIERFDWWRSHGSEVRELGASRWGWKLVRLGSSHETASRKSSFESDSAASSYGSREETIEYGSSAHGRSFASDGNEVVATWATSGR